MQVLVHLLELVILISAARERFELETNFNDRDLPQQIALGSSFITTLDVCAGHCIRNSKCSMFGFNKATSSCQLFGDVLSSSGSQAKPLNGARYYAYRTEWCPFHNHYYMFRSLNICVKLHNARLNYTDAISKCLNTGAQMIVLADEDKVAAVRTVLEQLGLRTTRIYVGADDMANEGEFVWLDGRNVTSEMWKQGEPNDKEPGEDCAELIHGALNDASCHRIQGFLCEMTK